MVNFWKRIWKFQEDGFKILRYNKNLRKFYVKYKKILSEILETFREIFWKY